MASPKPAHLVVMTTSAMATVFFRGQIACLRAAGFRVTFICNPGPQTTFVAAEGAEVVSLPMERNISVFKDMASLWRLWRTLRKLKPDIINVGTPKAGLLGGIAARATGVPRRIYTMHGLRLETATGWKRRLLTWTERIACRNAQYVRCVSSSLRRRAVELSLVEAEKAYVIAAGSSNGIDCERFRSTLERLSAASELRLALGIPDSAPVIGFVGRLTRDKGVRELSGAYERLRSSFPDLRLLLLGDFEDGDPVDPAVRAQLESDAHVHFAGMVPDTAPYYPLMNILALPTYREGFPNVPLEAQASGVPVVTTRTTGAADSVLDGISGKFVPSQDEGSLASALRELLSDPEKSRRMGQAGADWVRAHFRQELVWEALIADYNRVLRETGLQSGLGGVLKSVSDRLGAAFLLILVSPVLAIVALLVRWRLGGPVLFRQRRPGRGEKIFELLKFRTMTDARDAQGQPVPDEARLTPLGRRLRSLSLDELPQLWNVLRGEMSFVGPRPLFAEYLDRYTREQARRHLVKPGITGWAQVNGRNAISWDEKFALDIWYVDNWSLWLDFRILLLTAWRVLRRQGISSDQHATMPVFMGTKSKETQSR
jgi:lipopolysaccharide/colanic/teichoic acid biosynthesis glycosyltransferase/glycosyltransferase involved in cell wall biosynthesis